MSRLRTILAGHEADRPSNRPHQSRQIQHRLSPEDVIRLVIAYTHRETINALAGKFRVHRTTVMAHLERQGAPPRRGRVVQNIDEAIRLYEQGWFLARVGEHFGVDAETVRRALRSAGAAVRQRRGWHP